MTQSWSIRARLTRRVLAMVILAWLATIAVAMVFLNHEVNEMLDEELEALAETMVLSIETNPGHVIPRLTTIDPNTSERVLRIFSADQPPPPAPWPSLEVDGFHTINGWRVLRVNADHAVIELAHNMAWRREETYEAAAAFLILILPLTGLVLWLIGQTLRKGFRPIEDLSHSLGERSATNLDPIENEGLPDELQPFVAKMNTYLSRIDKTRQSERTFIANASHELRTPLAAIRASLELSPDPEAQNALPRIDALARRVERLLQLSRSQSGLGLGTGPSDLVQIIRLLQRDPRPLGRAPFHFDDGDFETYPLALDPDALAIVLRNLIENAQEHGSGPVWLRLREHSLSISNPITGGELEEAPFAKGPNSTGMGLGLSIVSQLCQAMDVTFHIEKSETQVVATLVF